MADRYFLPHLPDGDRCELGGTEFHHLAHVLRGRTGDHLTVFDGSGTEAEAEIVGLSKTAASLRLGVRRRDSPATDLEIVLATAVPKVDRFRWLVEKATELGVGGLIPLQTARSVVSPGALKLDKMRQAVIEACKQSGRNRLMEIEPLMSWREFVSGSVPTSSAFLADLAGDPLPDLADVRQKDQRVLLIVGPEGGLTEVERHEVMEAGARRVTLGPRILRIETAALAMAAVFLLK
ncbi:MAG TPA: RsmE family RNA methyltransferase [Planctomycetaceae bacterium]|jgi:16S rRNA (uracil1498-N3)-methyltransferase|nr:RsmE family RNA methyltransferase [Planctomycetaceae bacterium]